MSSDSHAELLPHRFWVDGLPAATLQQAVDILRENAKSDIQAARILAIAEDLLAPNVTRPRPEKPKGRLLDVE
jgi:hypothetical protein